MAKDKVSTYFKNQPPLIKCTKCVHELKRKFWNAHARVKLINMTNIYIQNTHIIKNSILLDLNNENNNSLYSFCIFS